MIHAAAFRQAALRRLAAGPGLAVALGLNGCATNPVSGQTDFVLMSEDQEIAIGRQSHAVVLQHYGTYDDQELQAFVRGVGKELAAKSHRSDLVYHFTVLDSTEVNAFALPGGYIYITRGLLAYLDSQADLAAVLGHEIGHVAARHAVRQHSAATAADIIGAVVTSQARIYGAGDIANVLGTALVRGYGREHELEADRLGSEYLARAGYDPEAMIDVIRVLKDQELFERQLAREENREPQVYHGLFATHPDNDRRLLEVVRSALPLRSRDLRADHREEFLSRIEGLTFGDSEREGVRRGRHFYHRPLNIALTFPAGWKVDNLPDRLIARPPGNDAVMQIWIEDINRRISPRRFMQDRVHLKDLQHEEVIRHNTFDGHTAIAEVNTTFGVRRARGVVLFDEDKAYVFLGTVRDAAEPLRYDAEFLGTARSLRRLLPEERELARPLVLKTIRVQRGTTFTALATRSRIPNHPEEQLRLLNHYYPEGEPPAGKLIKVVE